jgi:uncharacterized protein YebE (UPF0316 family)
MNTFIYFLIFIFKVLENTLSTLRIIVVANGRKLLGSILQGIIALVWAFSTGLVVVDVLHDPFKVVSFTLGSLVGSYIGSLIEEKIAMGTNMLTAVVDKSFSSKIIKALKKQKYEVIVLNGKRKDELKNVLFIMVRRKKRNDVIKLIKNIDCCSTIIVENAFTFDYINR